MTYKWESVGNQDECIRKICYLGPYMLEHVEDHWDEDILMMASNIWLWNDKDKVPELVAELSLNKYVHNKSHKDLEDWYALNILSEQLFFGVKNPKVPRREEK